MVKNKIKGKIFVTSSVAAYLPFLFLGCYTSSKAAITMLCKIINKELRYLNNGINISVVEPGAYHTGFNQRMIESKNLYLERDCYFYKEKENINRVQKNIFSIMEKNDTGDLVKKICIEMEKDSPKFKIRRPWYISILLKLYFLFWY